MILSESITIGDLPGIYAAIVVTATFIWLIVSSRRQVIIKVRKLIPEDEIMVTVINKTGEQISFRGISFMCSRGSMFLVKGELRTFDGKDWEKDAKGKPYVALINNARYVFWLSIKNIKKGRSQAEKDIGFQTIKWATIVDFHGRVHKGSIPRKIKSRLNA